MTIDEQLKLWVEGKSVHNGAKRDEGICCPDFSCCHPGLQWPKEKREAFMAATEKEQSRMLAGSLGAMLDYLEIRKVHIVGP